MTESCCYIVTYMYINPPKNTRMCVYIHGYIHIYIYIYVYVYLHTHVIYDIQFICYTVYIYIYTHYKPRCTLDDQCE